MNNSNPIDRGVTFYGPIRTIDTNNYGGVEFEGDEVVVTNPDTNEKLYGRIMRNVSGFTVYKGHTVSHAATYRNKRFAGLTRLTAAISAGVVDPWLGAGGCRNGDLCLVFYRGKCSVYLADSVAADIVEGNLAFAITAATTGATTDAGKVEQYAVTATTADVNANMIIANKIGRFAQTALSTTKANTLVLVDLNVQ